MAARRDTSAFARGIARTVRGSLKRFVALTTITALGVTMLVGLRAACVDLRNSADRFFDEQNLFDVRVQSTLGLTDDDVAALAALDGVEVAEGGWSETAYTTVGSSSEKVDVKALSPTGLNEPLVLEGRLPETSGEVAVTERYLKDSGLSIGDVVSFRGDDASDDANDADEKDEGLDALDSGSTEVFERGEYTIVGSVLDPMEINAGEGTMSFRSSGGSQYSFFVVADEVVDQSVYTVAYVMVEGAEAPLCYSAEYEEIVDEVFQGVEDARAERERARGDQIRSDATDEVDEAEAEALDELADAEAELDDAQRELDEGRSEVADGQRELDERREDAMAQLDGAQATIDENRRELEVGAAEYAEGLAEYEAGLAEYEAALPGAEQRLRDGQAALDAARENLGSTEVPELGMTLDELEAKRDEIQAAVDMLPGKIAEIDEKVGGLADGLDAVASGLSGVSPTDFGLGAAAQGMRDAWAAVQALDPSDEAAVAASVEQLGSVAGDASGALGAVLQALDGMIADMQEANPENPQLEVLVAQREQVQELSDGVSGIDAAALVHGRLEAVSGLAEAQAYLPQLEEAVEQVRAAAEERFAESQAAIDQGWQELQDAYDKLESARALLSASAEQIASGRAQLAEGQAELDRQREDALAQLADAQAQLDDALAEIEDGQAELDEGRATFEQERDDAFAEIADAREEIEDLPDATWYVQDRSSLSSYASVDSDASSIEAIGTVLPIVFFVVAVLISLTTMTRMVEEERGLIGLYKALGYGRARILSKYVLYALAACLLGWLVGTVLGFVVLPAIIFTIFSTMYALPGFVYSFDAAYSVVSLLLFTVGIVGATALTCRHELRETPASLMLPKAPKAGARIFLERIGPVWRRMSFLNKVTARNLFRYKQRFLMTTLGVAGCVALLVTGFGIRDTVLSLSPRQYGGAGVIGYDLMAVTSADDLDAVTDDLLAGDEVGDLAQIYVDSVTVTWGDGKESAQLYVVPDGTDLSAYVSLRDAAGNQIDLDEAGVVVTKALEQVMDLAEGDEISLQDSTLAVGSAQVGAVGVSYLGDAVYMSESAYEEAFATELEPNGLLAHLTGDADEQVALSERLSEDSRYLSVVSTQKLVNDFSSAFTLINTVVYVVIVLAAALSFTVVFTLSNTNISERERELATLKVLGFKRPEVHRYINTETLILTGIGVVMGLPMGYALARSLTWILRMPSLYFDVVVDPLTYVIAAVMAFAFTLVVNLITNRALDRVDMVGALKSAE
ncbi:MAG TPA: FtsX-like permease family protein [Candidatus Olsenella stercoravium]|uniref:FtsX-like permease family protein n=1 Tax=Candidatus Olsenella stercoravium TaxID=2838713 RepID=A0A9D2IQ97_9ACTN|nr:FtsX-like permease family protein [Candidatus Olsenella stercoravium]